MIDKTHLLCFVGIQIAKMLNYMGGGLACDGTFSLFVLSWIYTRHYIFVKIIYAIYHQLPQDIILPKEVIDGYISRYNLWRSFLVLLSFLQCLLIFWLITILRVMWNVVMGYGADDDRSDSGSVFLPSPRLTSALCFCTSILPNVTFHFVHAGVPGIVIWRVTIPDRGPRAR